MACDHAPTDWEDWSHWLAAGLHGRSRWRLPVLMTGLLFASGRRVVAAWIRAAGVSDDDQDYDFFLQSVGRRWTELGRRILVLVLQQAIEKQQRVLVAIDDSPTKRYGPHVQGAGIHHDPTPGPAGPAFCDGHVWVTLAVIVRHPQWGTIGLPIWSWLSVRRQDVPKIPARHRWVFQTKLEQAADLVLRAVETRPPLCVKTCGQRRVGRGRWCLHQATVRATGDGFGRDAGGPSAEGRGPSSLSASAPNSATCRRGRSPVRVVIVKEKTGPQFFSCTDVSANVAEIIEAFTDRAAIEQIFHDVKEVWGSGQQQVRNLWTNVAVWH